MRKTAIILLFFCLPLRNAAQKRNAAVPVQVTVTINNAPQSNDIILYSRDRPLKIKDFRGVPDAASVGVAATYSGILMELEGDTQQGILQVSIKLTVYFDRSRSWMKREGKKDRILAHEQHHFDLTAIKACALARAIAAEKYTPDNVRARIKALQQLHTSELERLQQAYDHDSHHGTDDAGQAAWSEHIAGGLVHADCI